MIMKSLFLSLVLLASAPALAEDTPLQSLDSWGKNRGWEGVGLLDIAGRGLCTGALIRSDLVLTAAHCLYDAEKGAYHDPTTIVFRAGWRDGSAIAQRRVKRAVVHSAFRYELDHEATRHDLALLQLADAIQPSHALPFRYGAGAANESTVSVVSYGRGRFEAPSRQRSCDVLQVRSGVLALSCDVQPGSSGAPVFAMRGGRPEIVSVVSGIGQIGGKRVSYGMDIAAPLGDLLSDLRTGRGVFPAKSVAARRITVGSDQRSGGAKFLRP